MKKKVKVPTKKVTKLTTDKELCTPIIDITKIRTGYYYEAAIGRTKISGLIVVKGPVIYLCHNNSRQIGSDPKEKLGYKYAWAINDVSDVDELIVTKTPPKGVKSPDLSTYIEGHGQVIFNQTSITVGCTTIPNDIVRNITKKLKS